MKLNGVEYQVSSKEKLIDVLVANGYDVTKIAVEIDGEICPKAELSTVELNGDENVEVVSFVGGG